MKHSCKNSVSMTKQHFIFLGRSPGITYVYGEVKILTPWLNTQGQPEDKLFCAVSCDKVYRPLFFGEKTVNGIIYCDMLELCLMPQILEDKPNVFEHDEATPHIHNEVKTCLNRHFPEQ
jgi:hypothetical protein